MIMATTISQISGLAKLASASVIAPLDELDVTCASDTITIAISDITPIGMTFRMMATMVVRKIATRCQAFGSSPCGQGVSNSRISTSVVISAGTSRNGTVLLKYSKVALILASIFFSLRVLRPFVNF